MSFHKRSALFLAHAAHTGYVPASNVISLEQYRMSLDTDAARRDRVVAERNAVWQRVAELEAFIGDVAKASVGDDMWPFVIRAQEIMK